MKVIISVGGRFHGFHLARELYKHHILEKLLTIGRLRKNDRIPRSLVKRHWMLFPIDLMDKISYLIPLPGRISTLVYWYKNLLFDRLSARYMNKNEADIFHVFTNQGLESVRAAKKKGIITIADCGSTYIEYQKKIVSEEYRLLGLRPKSFYDSMNENNPYNKKIINRGIKEFELSDYIMIPSDFVKMTFPKRFQDKILVVPYGVDLTMFKKTKKRDDLFRIIYSGRIEVQKGIHYLLKAFMELDLPKSELMLLGFVESDFRQIIKRYDSKKIKVMGHIRQDVLYQYYSQGSVFVHPSVQEGLSLVLVEAMACGLPIIATENTGAGTLIDDGAEGYVIPIRDVEEMKNKIKYLYDNRNELEMMSRNAHKKSKRYTWDAYGKRVVDAYKQVLA